MRSMERMLEPSASALITAICLSVLSTFAMSITVLHKGVGVKYFSCYNYERLNEADNTDDKPEQHKEQSLPLSQSVPTKSPLEAPTQPPTGQQNIASPPPNNPSRNAQDGDLGITPIRIVNDPLRTREIGEDKLGEFERTTLLYARGTFFVTFLTLIAIVGTAIVFWDQFQEMAAQTNI